MSLLKQVDDLLDFIDTQFVNANDLRTSAACGTAPPAPVVEASTQAIPALQQQTLAALAAQNLTPSFSISHDAVMTSAEHAAVLGSNLNGVLVKNLFLKKKKGTQRWLLVFRHDKTIDLKAVGKTIGAGSGLKNARDLETVLGVSGGCVTPLAVMNDAENQTTVVLDSELQSASCLNIHPCVNTSTVSLTPAQVQQFVESCGNAFEFADFEGGTAPAAAPTTKPAAQPSQSNNKKSKKKQKKKGGGQKKKQQQKKGGNKKNQSGMTITKEEDFGEWYAELVKKSGLIDYTDISGCYVLRPTSFFMWEQVRNYMDPRIGKLGVKNAYFPLFVSEAALMKEEDHVDGFAPEVAWVTKSGKSDLEVPIAVRPTSETIMYPIFQRWIRSHTDLPLKINQWCNVVRWEFKNPTPFIRTREFLWQEGHTVFATKEEAMEEVYQILDIYADTYADVLAIPTIKGAKTDEEKFPGGETTTTVEAYVPGSGRAIQGATSHCLGQNFGKMFKIRFESAANETGEKLKIPYQNSWGFTTRSIGVAIMNHSDNKGLVVPPTIAMDQVVVIPIIFKNEEENAKVRAACQEVKEQLCASGIRAVCDLTTGKTPGWKRSEYELQGVPVRLEVGPRDLKNNAVFACRRDTGAKESISLDNLETRVRELFDEIHQNLYNQAEQRMMDNIVVCLTWDDFIGALSNKHLAICPSANTTEVENNITARTKAHFDSAEHDAKELSGKAKSLCIPFDQDKWGDISDKLCIESGQPAECWILYGRSY